jgi:hypothetical protein
MFFNLLKPIFTEYFLNVFYSNIYIQGYPFLYKHTMFILKIALYYLHFVIQFKIVPYTHSDLFNQCVSFLLLCWLGVNCGIYKISHNMYNISYLNSPPPPFYFIPLPPCLEEFPKTNFFLFVFTCTVFAPYSPFHTLSLPPPLSH